MIAEWIIAHIPDHSCWVSATGGGAGVLINKPRSKTEVYNDIWDGIVCLFTVLRDKPKQLKRFLKYVPYSRSLHQNWTERYKNGEIEGDVEKAACVFYLLRSSVNAIFGNDFSAHREKVHSMTFKRKVDKLEMYAERFRGVIIENLDFREVIKRYDGENTAFYFDPPYMDLDHYEHGFTYRDHYDLAKILQGIEGKAIVSYYPTDDVLELYPEDMWHRSLKTVLKRSAVAVETRSEVEELLLTNFVPQVRAKGRDLTEVFA